MVILTFEDVNSGFTASTTVGILQVVQFQGKFYAIRKVFRRLQEAIDTCRQDLEEGFCSIVVRHGAQAEVWAALSREVPISPFQEIQGNTAPVPAQRKPQLMFRGRVFQGNGRGQSLSADLVEGQFYRGQRLSITTLQQEGPPPDEIFFRGKKMAA